MDAAMRELWSQFYDATKQNIMLNPSRITWERQVLVDNGRGVMVPDPDGASEPLTAVVRIAHESSSVPNNAEGAVGLSTNKSFFVMATSDVDLRENDVITETKTGKEWKLGPVDPQGIEGEAFMIQAPLYNAKEET